MQKGRYTGIPRYKNRKEGKEFLKLLEACRTNLDDMGFAEKNPALYKDIDDFLHKAKQITILDLQKKPSAVVVIVGILVAIAVVVYGYGLRQRQAEDNIEALKTMEVIHDKIADDEVEALILMARDS